MKRYVNYIFSNFNVFFYDEIVNFFDTLYDIIESILFNINLDTIFANFARKKKYRDEVFDDDDDENETRKLAKQKLI